MKGKRENSFTIAELPIFHLVLKWDNVFGTRKSANWNKKGTEKVKFLHVFVRTKILDLPLGARKF